MGLEKKREDILDFAIKDPVGIELGVATGEFSSFILSRKNVKYWYSVDMWAGDRGHDVNQYIEAVTRLLPYKQKNTVLRLKFEEALSVFPNNYFDFIYVDGYAHTGQEDGKTLTDWWPKLKPGGIFAGDDYDPFWAPTVNAVDKFIEKYKTQNSGLKIFDFKKEGRWGAYPSWYTKKNEKI